MARRVLGGLSAHGTSREGKALNDIDRHSGRHIAGRKIVRGMQRLLLLFLLLNTLQSGAAAPPAPSEPEAVEQGVVREVTDGDTLTLDNGLVVRLVGIQAPKLALGRTGFKAWPLAQEARDGLQTLSQGRTVMLAYGGVKTDRHRRALAHLTRQPDGLWVQGEMLRLGLARLYTFSDNRALAPQMRALENEARDARRGIWSHPFYAVRSAQELNASSNGFQLAQGKVLKSAKIRDYIFLNFGPDHHTDFTGVIERADWPRFASSGIDPQSYAGRMVRLRGWLEHWNGPMMRISHPEQIEVLE